MPYAYSALQTSLSFVGSPRCMGTPLSYLKCPLITSSSSFPFPLRVTSSNRHFRAGGETHDDSQELCKEKLGSPGTDTVGALNNSIFCNPSYSLRQAKSCSEHVLHNDCGLDWDQMTLDTIHSKIQKQIYVVNCFKQGRKAYLRREDMAIPRLVRELGEYHDQVMNQGFPLSSWPLLSDFEVWVGRILIICCRPKKPDKRATKEKKKPKAL